MKPPGILFITRGLPASGKTMWARGIVDSRPDASTVRLNRDDLRASMLPTSYRRPKWQSEELVSTVQHGAIPALLRAGVDVIADDTNLRAKNSRALAQLAVSAGAQWECVDFLDVPLEVCLERDRVRAKPVGDEVILEMHRKFLAGGRTLPLPDLGDTVTGKPYTPPPGGMPAVMVDIDGTVALHGDRDPYDTSRYHEDAPNPAVIDAVQADAVHKVLLFCSGRSEEFRDVTEQWLADHVLPRGEWELFMRPAGDTRNDAIVKLELFDQHIRDRYRVFRVYDDRDRVVEAWRSIGLSVFQVAPGNF